MNQARRLLALLLALAAHASATEARFSAASDAAENLEPVWFGDLLAVEPLEEASLAALPALVQRALGRGDKTVTELPEPLRSDEKPRAVFLSASDGESTGTVACGTGRGLACALERAIAALASRCGHGSDPAAWLKLDVVSRVQPYVPGAVGSAPFERSLEGLAYGRASRAAFLPEELVARTLVNADGKIQARNIDRYRRERLGVASDATLPPVDDRELLRFTTASFFHDGAATYRLYRGNRPRPELTRAVLLDAAKVGADYLRRAVRENGSFVYRYFPKSDVEGNDYNLVRHAGTIFSMLDVYETSRGEALRSAAERAIAYLLVFVHPFGPEADDMRVVVEGRDIKLGGVALSAVALAEHTSVTGSREHLPLAQALCRYIAKSQMEDGKFILGRTFPDGAISRHSSSYYPGEAILALVRVHALDSDPRWLDVAEKGARYLIEVRDKGKGPHDLEHDHWLLYALNELYRSRKEALYLEHALRIVEAIELEQNRAPRYPDWLGSYYDPPRSTPAACRTEGLVAAYRLARDHGRADAAASILATAAPIAGFQLLHQVRPEKALYCSDPPRALGGFTQSLTNYEIRIDCVQHNISALVGLYRVLAEAEREKL